MFFFKHRLWFLKQLLDIFVQRIFTQPLHTNYITWLYNPAISLISWPLTLHLALYKFLFSVPPLSSAILFFNSTIFLLYYSIFFLKWSISHERSFAPINFNETIGAVRPRKLSWKILSVYCNCTVAHVKEILKNPLYSFVETAYISYPWPLVTMYKISLNLLRGFEIKFTEIILVYFWHKDRNGRVLVLGNQVSRSYEACKEEGCIHCWQAECSHCIGGSKTAAKCLWKRFI